MAIDEKYYDRLDEELTLTDPPVDTNGQGVFAKERKSIIVLNADDVTIAKELAKMEDLSVSDYVTRTLRAQLAAAS
ncbi:MAG: hypothetical protein LBP28_03890 [Coriobacteriales bacterium]|jgi:hypothetical protein|nr:hypothetical protein [Coriobacteriales bacterium]